MNLEHRNPHDPALLIGGFLPPRKECKWPQTEGVKGGDKVELTSEKLPKPERRTKVLAWPDPKTKLFSSGLLGPVKVMAEE